MALVSVNPARPRERKQSRLEQIALGLDIANKTLGTALMIPEYRTKQRLAETEQKKLEMESQPLNPEMIRSLKESGIDPSGLSRKEALTLFETPKEKQARLRSEEQIELLRAQNIREGAKEERETVKFGREMTKPVLSPGEEKVDKDFAESYTTFLASGGFAEAKKGITQIKEIRDKIDRAEKENKNYTGAGIGTTLSTGRAGRTALSIANPEALDVLDQVEDVVQRNLRLILGAQFTENEGRRLIERAYNPYLEESENKRRLDRLVKQMDDAYNAKISAAKHYEEFGTLKGWKGTLIQSAGQFMADEKDADIQQYAEKFGLSYEQAAKIIQERRNKLAK